MSAGDQFLYNRAGVNDSGYSYDQLDLLNASVPDLSGSHNASGSKKQSSRAQHARRQSKEQTRLQQQRSNLLQEVQEEEW